MKRSGGLLVSRGLGDPRPADGGHLAQPRAGGPGGLDQVTQEASLNCSTPMSRVRNDIPALGAATMLINPCTAYRSVVN